jgi:1-acyl-sn-glycerol-3-phosphate acyltransferase
MRFGFQSLITYLRLTQLATVRFFDERTDKEAPVRLIVANHVTLLDVVILVAHYPLAFSLVKQSMTEHPLLRTIIGTSGFVAIDSNDTGSRASAFNKFAAAIRTGRTAIVFPEGTRTKTGRLGEFNKGAFKALMMTETNLTPIVISVSEPFLGGGSIFNNSGRKIEYRLTIFDNITTPVPEVPKRRDLTDFQTGTWNFFATRLNRQFAFPWNRMSNSFLHNGMSMEFSSETERETTVTFNLGRDYLHYRGHFETLPVLPAVSQIDLVRAVTSEVRQKRISVKQVRRAKFVGLVQPDQTLCLHLKWNPAASEVEWNLKGATSEFSRGILAYEA